MELDQPRQAAQPDQPDQHDQQTAQRVVGIDVGIRNFAFCIVEFAAEGDEYRIVDWRRVDLERVLGDRVTHTTAHQAIAALLAHRPFLTRADAVVIEGQMAGSGAPRGPARSSASRGAVETLEHEQVNAAGLRDAVLAAAQDAQAATQTAVAAGDVEPVAMRAVEALAAAAQEAADSGVRIVNLATQLADSGSIGSTPVLPSMCALQAAVAARAQAAGVHTEILAPRTVKAHVRRTAGGTAGSYRANKRLAVDTTRSLVTARDWTFFVQHEVKRDDLCDAFLLAWVWRERQREQAAKAVRKEQRAANAAARREEVAARRERAAAKRAAAAQRREEVAARKAERAARAAAKRAAKGETKATAEAKAACVC
jgi:hypothetical protein